MKTVGIALLLLAAAVPAQAQLYKWVAADGKINYTDTPPPPGARQVEARPAGASGSSPEDTAVPLPYELAQTAKNFPVVLYSAQNCGPCEAGRSLLVKRGIPFTEKTIKSNDDVHHLQQISGDTELPVLLIGRKKQQGFSPAGWDNALSDAGYPKASMLPKNYRNPAPQPAVALREEPAATATAAGQATLPPPALPAGNAPPGFRF